jgi:hypothetical protein
VETLAYPMIILHLISARPNPKQVAAPIMEDLGFEIVKTNGGDELLARNGNYEICKAAFEKAIFVYPNDHLEMRQGARVILKSKEQS